jgi:serine/threonine protein kinase
VLDVALQLIGQGAFGKVVEGLFQQNRVVIKASLAESMDERSQRSFAREAYLSAKACKSNHANVVKFYGACVERTKYWYLVYQMIQGGSVAQALLQQKRYSSDSLHDMAVVVHMAVNAASGLQHLHEVKIVHRDVACRNLLLDSAGNVWYVDGAQWLCVGCVDVTV